MELFELPSFSTSETHEIAEALRKPAVVKYLKSLAFGNAVQIVVSPKEGQSDTEYIRTQEQLRGGIAMVETLLSVKEADKEEQPQS